MEDILDVQESIPTILVTLKSRRGTKFNGIKIIPHIIFRWRAFQPGISASRLSAKSTTSAIQAPVSSKQNKRLVNKRAWRPKLIYAKSAYVTRVGSTSKHLASILAVYDVATAEKRRISNPRSHPAWLIPSGKLSRPMQIKTLTKLSCLGTVD